MTKEEAINQLCALVGYVGRQVFKGNEKDDCFCGYGEFVKNPEISDKIISYIVDSVKTRVKGTEKDMNKLHKLVYDIEKQFQKTKNKSVTHRGRK